MESEKVKEIKTVLERCKTQSQNDCRKCPYGENPKCLDLLIGNCLNCINELESENDEQYKRIMELEQDLVHADEKVFYRECNVTLRENEIKEQALKQFAERLKEKCEYNKKQYCCEESVSANDIDETLKECLK